MEVPCAGVEVGLEGNREPPLGEHAANGGDCRTQLLGVVGIVVDVDHLRGVDVDLKPTFHATEAIHRLAQTILVELTCSPNGSHRGQRVLHVDLTTHAEPATTNGAVGTDDVVAEGAVTQGHKACGVEVGCGVVHRVGVGFNTLVTVGNLQAQLMYECTALRNAFNELTEGALHLLVGAVDVEVVGIGGGNHGDGGGKAQERAVKLVGLHGHPLAATQQ